METQALAYVQVRGRGGGLEGGGRGGAGLRLARSRRGVYSLMPSTLFRPLYPVQDFERNFQELYPYRRPLYLAPKNECGVSKFVCTTLRPTQLK